MADYEITPEGQALLDAISHGESKGAWDIIYGGQRFSDFSTHPRVYVTIKSGPHKGEKSSAAGKYQITATTYDRVAPKLGITDFSPASQQKIAWYLANADYGPGLQEALEKGDEASLKKVGKRLASTWTSLPGGIEATTNGDKFVARYAEAKNTPRPPMNIPDVGTELSTTGPLAYGAPFTGHVGGAPLPFPGPLPGVGAAPAPVAPAGPIAPSPMARPAALAAAAKPLSNKVRSIEIHPDGSAVNPADEKFNIPNQKAFQTTFAPKPENRQPSVASTRAEQQRPISIPPKPENRQPSVDATRVEQHRAFADFPAKPPVESRIEFDPMRSDFEKINPTLASPPAPKPPRSFDISPTPPAQQAVIDGGYYALHPDEKPKVKTPIAEYRQPSVNETRSEQNRMRREDATVAVSAVGKAVSAAAGGGVGAKLTTKVPPPQPPAVQQPIVAQPQVLKKAPAAVAQQKPVVQRAPQPQGPFSYASTAPIASQRQAAQYQPSNGPITYDLPLVTPGNDRPQVLGLDMAFMPQSVQKSSRWNNGY